MTDKIIQEFVSSQKRCLQLEFDEEQEDPIFDRKITNGEYPQSILRNLEVVDVSLGLVGRTIVTLQSTLSTPDSSITRASTSIEETVETSSVKQKQFNVLPCHRLTVGDEVEILSKNFKQQISTEKSSSSRQVISGVLSAVTDETISIVLYLQNKGSRSEESTNDNIDDLWDSSPLTVVPRSSGQTHRKIMQALDDMLTHGTGHETAGSVIEAAFGETDFPTRLDGGSTPEIIPFNPNLDESQRSAIRHVLFSQYPITLIHGPPGTGKTTTIAELIKQCVLNRKWKVLVTAPSNVAVDNILERLVCQKRTVKEVKRDKKRSTTDSASSIAAVRLGHPARIKESILNYSLEYLIQKHEGKEIINDVRTEIESHMKQLSKKNNNIDRRTLYREIKVLKTEIKSREEKVVREIINSQAQVVLATNVGAASYLLEKFAEPFDLVIIDEAAQALEATCWIPILKGKRLVLAGDHCQLPPTIKSSNQEVQKELGTTLFERMIRKYAGHTDPVSNMLQIQYRMNEIISNWASNVMYCGKLLSHESVMFRRLEDLPQVLKHDQSSEDPNRRDLSIVHSTMVIVDTAGCNMHESVNAAGSRYNEGEAHLVAVHVRNLFRIGLSIEDIAVISPYNGQVFLLRNLLHSEFPSLEIRSVDGFQGGEKEAVILSLVRSGEDGVGFLKDDRRLNVAITRARRHCCIICDTDTISQHAFLKTLVDWVANHGDIVSAMEIGEQYSLSCIERNKAPARSKSMANVAKRKVINEAASDIAAKTNLTQAHKMNSQHTVQSDNDSVEKVRHKLRIFAEEALVGEEMSFTLSKLQRREIHQMCEHIGLAHRSEGTEGVDRRVVVSKYHARKEGDAVAADDDKFVQKNSFDTVKNIREKTPHKADDLCDEIGYRVKEESRVNNAFAEKSKELAVIAKERLMRREQANAPAKASNHNTALQSTLDDDMEYLNAEISRMQNSHGRKIDADGKNYLTIVNGVLMSKPKTEQIVSKNSSAKMKLDQKIKDAEDHRKRKSKNELSKKQSNR